MADVELSEDELHLFNIFHPLAMEMLDEARKNNTRFVHYTTADAAMKILMTKQVWMRNTSCMNDYMEVKHGISCLTQAYRGEYRDQFRVTLNGMFPGITAELEELFDGWVPYFQNSAFIACLSEHSKEEDGHGRLSMWRAYSGLTGVALVLNNAPFLAHVGPPGVYSSPVSYLDDESFEQEFLRLIKRISENREFLRDLGKETVLGAVFNAFKFAALCTKHPGFSEEREWRAIYMPSMEQSPYLEQGIEVVGGAPQRIYKFPLRNLPEIGYSGVEIPELLDRIIIGPTEYPQAIYEAFVTLLFEAGVEDSLSRVHVSGIPLRL